MEATKPRGWLCLNRKEGEEIVIGSGPEAIRVAIAFIRGRYVRVMISAPREIPIRRAELEPKEGGR